MDYNQEVYLIEKDEIRKVLFSEHWDFEMSYINDKNSNYQVSTKDLFPTRELAKQSIIKRYESIIEKEQHFLDNIDNTIKESNKKILKYTKLIKEI